MFHFTCFSWVNKALESKQVSLLVMVCGSQGPSPWRCLPPLKVGEWLGAAGEQLCQDLPCACTTQPTLQEWVVLGFVPLSSKGDRTEGRAALCSGRAGRVQTLDVLCPHCLWTETLLWVPPCLPSALPESRWGPAPACHIQCVSAQEMVVP